MLISQRSKSDSDQLKFFLIASQKVKNPTMEDSSVIICEVCNAHDVKIRSCLMLRTANQ